MRQGCWNEEGGSDECCLSTWARTNSLGRCPISRIGHVNVHMFTESGTLWPSGATNWCSLIKLSKSTSFFLDSYSLQFFKGIATFDVLFMNWIEQFAVCERTRSLTCLGAQTDKSFRQIGQTRFYTTCSFLLNSLSTGDDQKESHMDHHRHHHRHDRCNHKGLLYVCNTRSKTLWCSCSKQGGRWRV